MAEEKRPTPERIMQMVWGFAPPLMLEAAIRNRVFDVLEEGPKTVEEVSSETRASARGLRALMNALVGFEFLSKEGERYALTPESSAFLVSSKPAFHGGLFHHVSTQLLPNWMELSEIVRTGKPARQPADNAAFFRDFVEALFPMGYAAAQALAGALRIREAAGPVNVLDIGAGSGVWSIVLAQQSPEVRVTAVDWPEVIPVTRRVAERHGVGDRFRYVEGSMQEMDLGSGYQVAILGHILHGEGRERSQALLRRVAQALAPGGTLAVAEWIPNEERTGPPGPLIFAVNMLVNTEHGDTFTFGEMSRWLHEAGFENPRLLEAPAPSPLLLATKAS
jgi:ubiquinone/menaquinone biosynthesis C-methylase UbiE